MDIGINLLKRRSGITQKQYILEKKVFTWSIISFVLVVVVSIVIFVMNLLNTRKLENVEEGIAEMNAKFAGMQEANFRQLYLKNRLGLIESFFTSRVASREALQRVFSIDVPGVNVAGVSFEGETVIKLQLNAFNINSLSDVYEYFEAEDGFFIQVVNRGVSRNDVGEYVMQLELTLPKGDDGQETK